MPVLSYTCRASSLVQHSELHVGIRIIIAYYSHRSEYLCLLFQHYSLMLLGTYYSRNYASIICQGLIITLRRVCASGVKRLVLSVVVVVVVIKKIEKSV